MSWPGPPDRSQMDRVPYPLGRTLTSVLGGLSWPLARTVVHLFVAPVKLPMAALSSHQGTPLVFSLRVAPAGRKPFTSRAFSEGVPAFRTSQRGYRGRSPCAAPTELDV